MKNTTMSAVCPVPIQPSPRIQMAHGGGGTLMHQLLEQVFLPAFENDTPSHRHDSAVFNLPGKRLAFTTDSYVVRPVIFPGGDIGSLAVHGTVNDLAMSGARPLCLSAGFILEEGLPLATLRQVVNSMRDAARCCGVRVVTGDTKVVDQGNGDGLFINTSGIGVVEHSLIIAPGSVAPGDAVLVSGDLGRHGMAIMSVREGLGFEATIESDSTPLASLVLRLIESGVAVHCLRDLTRGGLASALNEIAEAARLRIMIDEVRIPVREDVHAACEILGLDPLHVACEGRFVAFVAAKDTDTALGIMRMQSAGVGAALIGKVQSVTAKSTKTTKRVGAALIGEVQSELSARVVLRSAIGQNRVLEMPSGEQLPRIC